MEISLRLKTSKGRSSDGFRTQLLRYVAKGLKRFTSLR